MYTLPPVPDQPHNPMVNSGAIMSASILLYLVKPEMDMAQKYDYVFDFFKASESFYSVRPSVRVRQRRSLSFRTILPSSTPSSYPFPSACRRRDSTVTLSISIFCLHTDEFLALHCFRMNLSRVMAAAAESASVQSQVLGEPEIRTSRIKAHGEKMTFILWESWLHNSKWHFQDVLRVGSLSE